MYISTNTIQIYISILITSIEYKHTHVYFKSIPIQRHSNREIHETACNLERVQVRLVRDTYIYIYIYIYMYINTNPIHIYVHINTNNSIAVQIYTHIYIYCYQYNDTAISRFIRLRLIKNEAKCGSFVTS